MLYKFSYYRRVKLVTSPKLLPFVFQHMRKSFCGSLFLSLFFLSSYLFASFRLRQTCFTYHMLGKKDQKVFNKKYQQRYVLVERCTEHYINIRFLYSVKYQNLINNILIISFKFSTGKCVGFFSTLVRKLLRTPCEDVRKTPTIS